MTKIVIIFEKIYIDFSYIANDKKNLNEIILINMVLILN